MPGVIKISPAVLTDKRDAMGVVVDEALRLFMEDTGFEPEFDVPQEQLDFFSKTAYAGDEAAMRKTIVARIATFDTSIANPTPEQVAETIRLLDSALGVFKGQSDGGVLQRIRDELEKSNKDINSPVAQSPTLPDRNSQVESPVGGGEVTAQEPSAIAPKGAIVAETAPNSPKEVQSAENGGDIQEAVADYIANNKAGDMPASTNPSAKQPWSAAVIDYLRKVETFRPKAYPDPGGQTARWAVGYGNQFHPGQKTPVRSGDTVTRARAEDYLGDAVAYNVGKLRASIGEDRWDGMTGGQKLALTSWAYNVGETNARNSALVRMLRRGVLPSDAISKELPKWRDGGRADARRAEELSFARSGVYE
jgi:GH24 family phage-related lysozyme (muramidase)